MAACLLACTGAAHAALQLQPVEGGLTEPQRAATRQLLDEAAARLPASWTASLDRRIALEWRDDLPEDVHGRAKHHRLLLDRRLLDAWMARPRDET